MVKLPALKWLIRLRAEPKSPKKPEVLKMIQKLLDEVGHLAKWIDENKG